MGSAAIPLATAAMGAYTASKGGGPGSETSGPPAWATPYLQQGASAAQGLLNSGAGAIAPFNANQIAGQNYLTNYANTTLPGLSNSANSAYSFLTNPGILNPSSNPYLAQSVQAAIDQITQAFRSQVLPGINNAAISSGMFGGSRQGIAQGLAANNYMTDVGNTSANMYSDAYKQGLNSMLSGLALSPTVNSFNEQPGTILNAVGTVQQQQQQNINNQPWTNLGNFSDIIAQLLGRAGTTITGSGPSTLQELLGGASGGLGLYSEFEQAMKNQGDGYNTMLPATGPPNN